MSLLPHHARPTARRGGSAHARRLRCAGILLAVAATSCAGDEFESSTGAGGAGATSGSSTTTSSGDGGGGPATTSSSTVTSGEGGSAVSTGGGGGGGEGGGSEGGGGSGPVGDCDPEVSGEQPIPGSCGIFVDPNLPEGETGTGTKDDPFRSLADALAIVAGLDERRVYVKSGIVGDSVLIDIEGVQLHGGLSQGWTFQDGARTEIVQPAGDVQVAALEVRNAATEVRLEGWIIRAKEPTLPGESSIGILSVSSALALERVTVSASDGIAGADGQTPSDDIGNNTDFGFPDEDLTGGNGGLGTGNVAGARGPGGFNMRPGCDGGVGGDGGRGASTIGSVDGSYSAGDGFDGEPSGGNGGEGASFSAVGGPSECTAGSNGSDGSTGPDGVSATGTPSLSPVEGFLSPQATAGTRGAVGRGAGGGGGGLRDNVVGDGGGGGGAGGCGGFGGTPGGAGGSSVGLVLIEGSLSLESVAIGVGNGGDGGDGSSGQRGAMGGLAGFSNGNGCAGGFAGRGGRGGDGGAGSGGSSIGIVHDGTDLLSLNSVVISRGVPGAGGTPTDANLGIGAAGLTDDVTSL